jgi:hypothetical protein
LKLIAEGHNLFLLFEEQIEKVCKQILTIKTKHKGKNIILGFIKCQDKTILNDIAIFALANMELGSLILSYQYDDKQNKFSLRRL